jgi:hypothetical protein
LHDTRDGQETWDRMPRHEAMKILRTL